MKLIRKTPDKKHILSTPPFIQLELTTGCTQKCKHCYNYWRTDNYTPENISMKRLHFVLDEIIKNKVMHVVLSGGEPLLNFDKLLYAAKKLIKANISVSVNSNVSLATSEKMRKLRKAGVPHILTSLNESTDITNDHITSTKGSFKKIKQGIKNALSAGIRVSINMVVSKYNINKIYPTAKLADALGCQKFNITRTIPIVGKDSPYRNDFVIDNKKAKKILDEAIKIEKDFNFEVVSAMIPFPYCFLSDLEKYKCFLDKCACVAGTKLMSINVNGNVHACVHEGKSYGNIFEDGLKGAWNKLKGWQKGKYFPDNCKKCILFDECVGGCRMSARAHNKIDGNDNLKIGYRNIKKTIPTKPTKAMYNSVEKHSFKVNPNIRFRKEKGFYYVTLFGAKGVIAENSVADFLKKYSNKTFTLKQTKKKEIMAECLFYNLIQPKGTKAEINEFQNIHEKAI